MRVFIAPQASTRKLLLFACASCRRIAQLMTDARSLAALAVVERYADGLASDEELGQAREQADQAWQEAEAKRRRRKRAEQAVVASQAMAAYAVLSVVTDAMRSEVELKVWYGLNRRDIAPAITIEWSAQAHFLRDIFGNPLRPASITRTWLTPDVIALAQAAYDQRSMPDGALAPGQLAILADALEEAGCANTDILSHCRGQGPHIPGCWVVDRVLGKW
jgi:hypothetical protein